MNSMDYIYACVSPDIFACIWSSDAPGLTIFGSGTFGSVIFWSSETIFGSAAMFGNVMLDRRLQCNGVRLESDSYDRKIKVQQFTQVALALVSRMHHSNTLQPSLIDKAALTNELLAG